MRSLDTADLPMWCLWTTAYSALRLGVQRLSLPDDVIALAVRWYVRYRLPYADIPELFAERGIHVDPSTVFDWVQQFTPMYQDAARPRRRRVGQR